MAKKKLTANQKAWKTAVDKLKRKVRDIGKRGFLVNPDIIPQTRPKRVTKKETERIELDRELWILCWKNMQMAWRINGLKL